MKKKVAFMVFSNSIGGAESVVLEMMRHINKSKFEVYLITNDEIIDRFTEDDINKYSVGNIFKRDFFSKAYKRLIGEEKFYKRVLDSKISKVDNFIRNNEIEVVHSNLIYDHYLNSKLTTNNFKRVMTIHGSHGLDTNTGYAFSSQSIFHIYNTADVVISACQYFLNLLKEIDVSHPEFHVVENGININMINLMKVDERNDGKLNLVYLGGTRLVKGWDLLVDAMNYLINSQGLTNLHLDVLRDVPKESDFYKRVIDYGLENYISFIGYVTNGEHLTHISKSNLFVLPSRTEGIANTLMEAIGMSKPILATDVGGTSEVVNHKMNGYLCETTVESLTEGLLFFYDNPEKLVEFTKANESIKGRFYWETILPKYEAIYK